MPASFESLERLDAKLAKHGIPALSPFWAETMRRWYAHPSARTLVLRVGRRGGKGLTATKVAINEALRGDWKIPAGEVHRFVFVSVSKDEAAERLRMLATALRKIGEPFTAKGDELLLQKRPIAFRVCAATIAATSGYAAIGASIDETSKLGDYDSADPVDELITSVQAMCATHRGARLLLPSSPWGVDDAHARRFDEGDTSAQIVAHASSWIANPSLVEDELRAGKSALHFEREFAAIPGDTDTSAFSGTDVQAAFARELRPGDGERWILIDASKLQSAHGDDFAIAVACGAADGGICVLDVDGVSAGGTMRDAVARVTAMAREHEATRVFGDPFESGGLRTLLQDEGLDLATPPWTVRSKHEAGALLSRLFREGLIALPEHARMRHELLTMRARLRQNGALDYPTNGRDYAATLFAMAHAVEAKLIDADALSLHATPWKDLGADPDAALGLVLMGGRADRGAWDVIDPPSMPSMLLSEEQKRAIGERAAKAMFGYAAHAASGSLGQK